MNQDSCRGLIHEYRKKQILWNTRYPSYYSKTKKEEAWKDLATHINMPVDKVKKKIESLKGTYRKEKSRIKQTSQSGRDQIYTPKWFGYELLHFLDVKCEPRKTLNNLEFPSDSNESDNQSEVTELKQDQDIECFYHSKNDFNYQDKCPTKHNSTLHENDEGMIKTFGRLKEITESLKQQKDQCGLFGDYVADYLRKFNNPLRSIAQHEIHSLLFKLEMSTCEINNGSIILSDKSNDLHIYNENTGRQLKQEIHTETFAEVPSYNSP
ncbi:hypothetical protein FQA39_LY11886 [Lamprigera yunnana]|nr:hypothetical protein FQA39_LY11886 [Lamprigera yunnana]